MWVVLKKFYKMFVNWVEYPLLHPEIYEHIGVKAPCGILLHGPPGCGKTLLAHAVAGELELPFFKISSPEIVSGMSGQSETKIRLLFANAKVKLFHSRVLILLGHSGPDCPLFFQNLTRRGGGESGVIFPDTLNFPCFFYI